MISDLELECAGSVAAPWQNVSNQINRQIVVTSLEDMQDKENSSPTTQRPKRLFAPVTLLLFTANVAVFGWMLADGDSIDTWTADYLLRWGANYAPHTMSGQSWRMFTCLFVHGGILHLVFNLWLLWQMGRLVENLVGSASFLILYMASGLCSSLAGLWFNPYAVIVGVSGALFGLVGSLFAFMLVNHRHLQTEGMRKLRNNSLLFMGCNLVLGVAVEQIDWAGHSAGLVAGFVLSLLLMQRSLPGDRMAKWRRIALATSFATVLLWSATRVMPSAPPDVYGEMARFTTVEHDCLRQYNEAQQRLSQGQLTKREFLDVVDRDLLPRWRAASLGIVAMHRCPTSLRHVKAKLNAYIQARQQSWELLVAAMRENNNQKLTLHHERWSAAENLARELSTAN